ncbi:MAG: hypothetical protein N2314_04020 [Brevinematales bacterium]|nr:hypothetical protein [Brevinematales bacterium]
MIVCTEAHALKPENWLLLTRWTMQRISSPQWIRAILWEGEIYPYEGEPSCEQKNLLLFVPQTPHELLLCLQEALLFQGGKEEIEWAGLFLCAHKMGVEESLLFSFFSPWIPLAKEPNFWLWLQSHHPLITKAALYGISLRLLWDWRNDLPWLLWLPHALDVLRPHGNQLRLIRQLFLSVENGRNWSHENILEEVRWEEIQSLHEPPSKRLEILLQRLKNLRYPLLVASEGKLQALATCIKQKTGWKITWPPFLEGDALTLHVLLQSPKDLASLSKKCLRISQEIKDALSILLGENYD